MAAAGTQKPRLAYEDYFPQTSGSSASHQSTDVSSAVRTNSTKSSFTLDPLERTEMEKRIKVLVTAEDDEDFKVSLKSKSKKSCMITFIMSQKYASFSKNIQYFNLCKINVQN